MTYELERPSRERKPPRMPSLSAQDPSPRLHDGPSPAPQKSNRTLILSAAGWSTGGYVASQFVRIASNLILTRLLAPEMFGIAAAAAMVSYIVVLLADIGLHQAVIQSPRGDDPEFLDTVWVVQIIRGTLIWIGCIVIAVAIGHAASLGWMPAHSVYASPELPLVIILGTSGIFIDGFQSTKRITSYRRMGLNRITMIDLYSQLGATALGLAVAWLTHSVWACIVFGPASALITTILSHVWIPGRQDRFRLNRKFAVELLRFGRWIMFSSFFTILASNGDKMMMGSWASTQTFGLYTLAFGLIGILDGVGARLQSSVTLPALSKMARENRERFRTSYLKLRASFDIFYLLGAGGIFACGQLVVDLVYDDRYAAAGPMLQILSFSLVTARYGIMNSVYLAIGEPRNVGILNLAKAGLLFVAVPISYWLFGFEGALWAAALHQLPIIPLIFFYNSRHRLNSVAFEVFILLAWPAGYLIGRVLLSFISYVSAGIAA
ncbi:oligosaccharide flippase family protein [Rhizobium sp. S152]|uniref:oligosaccharide flippase family protein n=1 Tax=Rhizobium sp. S152 TaxID=3055038 RepID=UPI0025A95305|nr:oligosaccharide flippase family protein [Rhizobium sp. S152]MDM9624615.1 oligosaccharide flippase family protein [Rhizobium sp. S152]